MGCDHNSQTTEASDGQRIIPDSMWMNMLSV